MLTKLLAGRDDLLSCRKLVEAEEKYNNVTRSMQESAAEYNEVLSQYDLEFEEKGQQMSNKLQQVCCIPAIPDLTHSTLLPNELAETCRLSLLRLAC